MTQNCSLKLGGFYLIKSINASLDFQYRRKLIAMGMIPGAQFEIKRIAPLGGPVQVQIDTTLLSLRRQELLDLLVLEAL